MEHYQLRRLKFIENRLNDLETNTKVKFRALRGRNYSQSLPLVFKLIVTPLLMIGCSLQAFEITKNYLKYDVIAQPIHFPLGIVIPPLFTICIAETFIKACPNFSCYSSARNYLNSTPEFEQVVDRLSFIPPGGDFFESTDIEFIKKFATLAVTKYTIYQRICFAINIMKFFQKKHYTDSQIKSNTYRHLLSLRVFSKTCIPNRAVLKGCDIQLTSPGNLVTNFYGNSFKLKELQRLTYIKKKLVLMPYPYVTNCRDYEKEGLFTQEGCIAKCSEHDSISQKLPMNHYFPVTKDNNYSLAHVFESDSRRCESKCSSVGCVLRQYSIIRKSEDTLTDNHTLIVFSFSENTTLIVYYLPKISIWEFLTLFSSIFGSWLGLSLLGFSKALLLCYRKFLKTLQ